MISPLTGEGTSRISEPERAMTNEALGLFNGINDSKSAIAAIEAAISMTYVTQHRNLLSFLWAIGKNILTFCYMLICIIGFLLSTKLMISPNDIFLGFLAGFFQVGFGFIFITIGARTTPSAMVGIIMLSESVLGPIWAFLFVSERPSTIGLVGGAIILSAVLLQFYSLLNKNKKSVSN